MFLPHVTALCARRVRGVNVPCCVRLDFGLCWCGLRFYFFFSSRRRHTRLSCYWSSDVCSSDLTSTRHASRRSGGSRGAPPLSRARGGREDRKSVGWGKRGELGGRRIIKKKIDSRRPRCELARRANRRRRPPRAPRRPYRVLFFFKQKTAYEIIV